MRKEIHNSSLMDSVRRTSVFQGKKKFTWFMVHDNIAPLPRGHDLPTFTLASQSGVLRKHRHHVAVIMALQLSRAYPNNYLNKLYEVFAG